MKKIAIIICFLVIILPRARSQDVELSTGGGGLSYGVKLGMVSSTFAQESQKLETIESRTGLSLGLYGNYQINDKFSVTVEALYVQEGVNHLDPNYIYYTPWVKSNDYNVIYGGDYNNSIDIRRVNSNVTLHNVEFPFFVNYSLPKMGEISARVFLGGSFDIIAKAYSKNLLAVYSSRPEPEAAYVLSDRYFDVVTSSFKYYNFSGVIGAGIDYGAYSLDIRYKLGFVPINNLATLNLQNYYLNDFTSNALMISVGVNIQKLIN